MTFRHTCILAIALAVAACAGATTQEQRVFRITWVESGDTYVGTFAHQRGARSGSAHFTIDGQDCESRYRITQFPHGEWETDCGEDGPSAKGQFKALGGRGQAVRGTGVDNLGREVTILIDVAEG